MPIRSPRGRASAYRAIWQWPLVSPARLAIVVAAVLAVAVGVSTALTALNPPVPGTTTGTGTAVSSGRSLPTDPGPNGTGGGRAPVPTSLPPVPDLAPTVMPLASAPPAALAVATGWTTAWLRPAEGTTAAQWIEGLRPSTTDEYLGVLATVDPAAVPATRITGEPRALRVTADSVDVEVPTDALTLVVLVVLTDNGEWRVAGYDRAA